MSRREPNRMPAADRMVRDGAAAGTARAVAGRSRRRLVAGIVAAIAMVVACVLPAAGPGAARAFAADNGLPDGSLATWRDLTLTTDLDRADTTNNTDTGVATYVGRDYYVGGRPSDTRVLNANNAPTGTYAAESEGLTVIAGKLAMNPVKNTAWNGQGFRFVTAGFGSQFRPAAGKVGLVVSGTSSAIGTMTTGGVTGTVGAWTRGGFIGPGQWGDGSWHGPEFAGKLAGAVTRWQSNSGRASIVGRMTWYDTDTSWWNQTNVLADVNGTDYSDYGSQVQSMSTKLAAATANGSVTVGDAPAGSVTVRNYASAGNNASYTFSKGQEGLITFTGDGTSRLQVFDVTAAQLNSFGSKGVDFAFENIASNAPIVVNVSGGPVSFAHGWRMWWNGTEIGSGYVPNSTYSSQYGHAAEAIMWNFADATDVTIKGGSNLRNGAAVADDPAAEFVGSIMVPKGGFDCHLTTNGRVWVGGDLQLDSPTPIGSSGSASIIDMDLERHNFPWAAEMSQSAGLKWNKANLSGTLLTGSSFAVYGSLADAKAGDTSKALIVVSDGDLVSGDWSGGDDGSFTVEGLAPNANYYLRETEAPAGYEVNGNIYQMPTGAEGTVSSVVFQVYMAPGYALADGSQDTMHRHPDGITTIVDASKGADVSWEKTTDGSDATLLGGSTWTLANGSDTWTITDATSASSAAGSDGAPTDADATAGRITLKDLAPGTYTLKEATPPDGYRLNDTTYRFTIADGTLSWDADAQASIVDGRLRVTDTPTSVSWQKTDGTSGAALDGSKWQLQRWDGSAYATLYDETSACGDAACPASSSFAQGDGLPDVIVTRDSATASFTMSGLAAGSYRLYESTVPQGYEAPSVSDGPYYYFTVSDEGATSAFTRGGAATDASGVPVDGAPLAGSAAGDGSAGSDGSGTGESGESSAAGKSGAQSASAAGSTAIANERKLGAVQWTKAASGGSTPLAGSEWTVTYTPATGNGAGAQSFTVGDCGSDGCAASSAGQWQVNVDPEAGRFKLENLPWGTYTVRETKAPDGYYLNEHTYAFTVDASTAGTVIALGDNGVITDEPGFVMPATGGDGSGRVAVVLGAVLVGVALVGCALVLRRQA